MSPTKKNILYMLKESNAIEGVYDKKSLTQARHAWEYLLMYDSLNTQIIKWAHKLLMKNQDIEEYHKGDWRRVPVWIGDSKKDQPPLVIDQQMRDWCKQANKLGDPIKDHVDFEAIHPFVDGNGRMGRILMNWQFVKMKEDIKVFTEEGRQSYYKLFKQESVDDLIRLYRQSRGPREGWWTE